MCYMTMPADDRSPLPWEVLLLVAHRLDPKTLAVSSCVCRAWSHSMSLDSLWKPPCATHFPTLCLLYSASASPEGNGSALISFHRLYALGQHASRRRQSLPPAKPILSLADIVFLVNVRSTTRDVDVATVFALANEFHRKSEVFHFDLKVDGQKLLPIEEVQVTWSVVLKEWKGMFTMLACKETKTQIQIEAFTDKWYTEELPPPACCSALCSSSLAAEVKLGIGEKTMNKGEMKVESVSVGIMSMAKWRYLSVDDGLRYLQNFLL